jgi:hypothetical protein
MVRGRPSGCIATVLLMLLAAVPAGAVVPLTAPPLPARVALADLIALGKVTSVEDEIVQAAPLVKIPGVTNKVPFRIAVVTIQSSLFGAEELKRVRVAFTPPSADGAKAVRSGGKLAVVRFAAGDEGCFLLRKHQDEPFYVASAAYDFMDKAKTKDFAKEIALMKNCVRLLADTKAGLAAKQADDRLLTAALLIYRYRTARHVYLGKPRTETIAADESKRILTILAEADWNAKDPPAAGPPLSLFLRLDLTKEDGWEPPAVLAEVAPAARKWLDDHAAEYRIRRYLPSEEAGK